MTPDTATPQRSDVAIALRPIRPDDQPFLYNLREHARAGACGRALGQRAKVGVSPDAVDASTKYQEAYAGSALDVILDGQPAGRLYVARKEEEIRIVDMRFYPTTATAVSGRRFCEGSSHE